MVFFSSRRRHTRYWRDWSSDVCSSDLIVGVFLGQEGERRPPVGPEAGGVVGDRPSQDQRVDAAEDGDPAAPQQRHAEIGRASCRERVQTSVVVASLKKNKQPHFSTARY